MSLSCKIQVNVVTAPSLDLQQQLAELRKAYIAQLPQKLAQMDEICAHLHAKWNAESAMDLYRQMHNLAGSGTTYGFPLITKEARELELLIKPYAENGTAMPERELGRFEFQIKNLREASAAGSTCHQPDMPLDQVKQTEKTADFPCIESLDILLADDDPISSALTAAILRSQGHLVRLAADGAEAVALFSEKEPDLVLLDVLMPVMDGYQAAIHIRKITTGRFIPIIFLTALTDDSDLTRCIEAGGDDFLSKPYTPAILNAKIMAMDRIRHLYGELEKYKQRTEAEIALSQHIYHTVTNRNPQHVDNMDAWHDSVGLFSGDLLAYQFTSDGKLLVLLGDFTGHGLAAAIGVIPAADCFYALVAKNFSLAMIASEINKKLHELLPTGQYCATCLMSIDFDSHLVEFWNGGLPPVLIFDSSRKCIHKIKSIHLPLGILGNELFDMTTETVTLENGSVVLYSDGVNEARNPAQAMFGLERIIEATEGAESDAGILAAITDNLRVFRDGVVPDDDTTLVVVRTGSLAQID